ncbi:polymeric immunoglobulin receptor-like [Siniperca chuatsi]|uniref:polymeric immunoglobulin receptor-like n=1 Tax=Siniperca chuatsi TaxID=119488 RepID=UPI001CE1AC6C|nr:polymeric immunoglobulin receptor-like [Siniperca chuatsi]
MAMSRKVIIYLITASVSLLSVSGNKGGPVNITCDNTPESQTAHHGGSVTISCKYPRAEESYIRHFCREDENFHCTNLISTYTSNYTKKGRFSLTDNKQQGVYTVTISTLTLEDAGRYQCTMERSNSRSCLTQIHLQVLNWDDIKPMAKTCHIGDSVNMDCHYPETHENNEKFLCKGKNPFNCEELIHTIENERHVDKGRFVIRDNRRLKHFFVYIKNVSIADSGTYWCGSDRTWQHDKYIKIDLSLVCCAAWGSSEDRTNVNHNTEGDNANHHYEEIQTQNQQASSGDVLPSICATINPPADQLNYASVSFQKDSVSVSTDGNALPDTNKNGPTACDYSSVSWPQGATHPPVAEQTLYSTVTKPGNQ